jgi:drug/metabolite transporter (DMT)-like permease
VGFGTLSVSARRLGELGVTAVPFVFWRSAVAGAVVLGVFALLVAAARATSPRPGAVPGAQWRALLLAAGAGAALNLAVFVALERSTVALVLITFYTFPAIVVLASARLYGERIDRQRGAALLLASAGLALVVLAPLLSASGVSLDPIGLALALVAAICQATFALVTGRGFPALPSLLASALLMLIAAVVYGVLTVTLGQLDAARIPLTDDTTWAWIAMAAIVGAALPTTAFVLGIRLIGSARAAILMTLEPVVGVVLAGLLLGEQPSPLQLLGGAAVIVAAVILQVPSRAPAASGATTEAPAAPP